MITATSNRRVVLMLALLAVLAVAFASASSAAITRKHSTVSKGKKPMTAQAPLDRSRPPALPAAPKPSLPTIQSQTLSNGLVLDVVEMHKAPVVDVTLVIRAGSTRDPDDLPGLATFTAGMLDEGAGKRTALEISEEIDFLGAEMSTSAGVEVAQITCTL